MFCSVDIGQNSDEIFNIGGLHKYNKPIEAAEKAEREVCMMIIVQIQECFGNDQDEVEGDDDDD